MGVASSPKRPEVVVSCSSPTFAACSTSDLRILARIRRWVRQRRDLLSLVADIDATLSAEHATGTLSLHYQQGRAAAADFREEVSLGDTTH